MTIRIVWGKSNGRVIAGSDQPAPPQSSLFFPFIIKLKKHKVSKKNRKKYNTPIHVHRLYTIYFARINFMNRNILYIKYLNPNLNLNRVYKLLTYKHSLYKF